MASAFIINVWYRKMAFAVVAQAATYL